MLKILLTWAVPVGIVVGFLLFLFFLRKKIAGGVNKAAQFFAGHKVIGVIFTITLIAAVIAGGIFFGWWLARPISAPSVVQSQNVITILEVAPSVLKYDYTETTLSVLGSGFEEFDKIWLQIKKRLRPDTNKELKDVIFLEKAKRQCLLATLPHLKSDKYDVIIKRWGKEISKKEKALVVEKNPYGFPKPSRWLLLFVFIFVVGILFWAFWGLTQKKESSQTPNP